MRAYMFGKNGEERLEILSISESRGFRNRAVEESKFIEVRTGLARGLRKKSACQRANTESETLRVCP